MAQRTLRFCAVIETVGEICTVEEKVLVNDSNILESISEKIKIKGSSDLSFLIGI